MFLTPSPPLSLLRSLDINLSIARKLCLDPVSRPYKLYFFYKSTVSATAVQPIELSSRQRQLCIYLYLGVVTHSIFNNPNAAHAVTITVDIFVFSRLPGRRETVHSSSVHILTFCVCGHSPCPSTVLCRPVSYRSSPLCLHYFVGRRNGILFSMTSAYTLNQVFLGHEQLSVTVGQAHKCAEEPVPS